MDCIFRGSYGWGGSVIMFLIIKKFYTHIHPHKNHIFPQRWKCVEICGWPLAKTTPTATHRFPQRWKSVEICGWPLAKTTPTATHRFPQRWKCVEICGWPLAKTTPTATHKLPQRWKSVEICGLMWVTWFVNFDLSILFPVPPMLGHMMLFAFMSFGDLNQAHVGAC